MDTFDLALVLTAAGATVSAGLIASLIQIIKRVPVFGAWLDAGNEAFVSLLLSMALVAYAYIVTTPTIEPVSVFGAVLAWVGIAGLATKAHDVTPASVNKILGGA